MPHITGHARCQTLLLPESLDDYVGPENPVRFIDAFVEGLDLAAAGFARVTSQQTGRPGYAPADLLKLYIYGYLNRGRSSRRLEAETHRNIEVIRLRHLKPDFKTIADFRRDNRNAFGPGAQSDLSEMQLPFPTAYPRLPPTRPHHTRANPGAWSAHRRSLYHVLYSFGHRITGVHGTVEHVPKTLPLQKIYTRPLQPPVSWA